MTSINNTGLAGYWKFDTANEQRKYAGQEYDAETGLSYMSAYGGSTGGGNARYYNGKMGRFVSMDPVYLAVGDINQLKQTTGLKLEQYLSDPQGFNSYAYARNNPLRITDPNGEWFKEVITGQQSWSSFTLEVGQAANYLSDNSSTWKVAMDHPYLAGGAIGIGGGLAAAGGAAVATKLSVAYLQGAGTACLAFCGQLSRSDYNTAVNWVANRGADPSSLPSRQEVSNVMDKWVNTNMPNKASSILYHYDKHADGNSLNALTKNGLNVWNNYINNSSSVKNVTETLLRNGDTGLRIKLDSGAGGIFTKTGNIVTTWFKN